MTQPRLSDPDRDSISQAAFILRNQYVHPPMMDGLAWQIYTNRLNRTKLNTWLSSLNLEEMKNFVSSKKRSIAF